VLEIGFRQQVREAAGAEAGGLTFMASVTSSPPWRGLGRCQYFAGNCEAGARPTE